MTGLPDGASNVNMTTSRTYKASCHCGAVRFTFTSAEITTGLRCNCSICIRKGAVMSSNYFPPSEVQVEGKEALGVYQFGDKSVNHHFCRTCGIFPFNTVTALPEGYGGPAKVGDCRVNLGCVEGLDALALKIELVDGRSF